MKIIKHKDGWEKFLKENDYPQYFVRWKIADDYYVLPCMNYSQVRLIVRRIRKDKKCHFLTFSKAQRIPWFVNDNDKRIFTGTYDEFKEWYSKEPIRFKELDHDKFKAIIDRWTEHECVSGDYGLFLTKHGDSWVAIDNTTNNCWVEDFKTRQEAINWLEGEDL